MATTGRAVVLKAIGSVDNFEFRPDHKFPAPGPNEVRVRVVAAAVNPVDYKMRRADWWGASAPGVLPRVIGSDVAGVIDAVGPGVTQFQPGDEVFGATELHPSKCIGGSYAEFVVMKADILAPKPASLTFGEAASLPLAACTALDFVEAAHLHLGDTVFIAGAGGGVGLFAIQMCVAAGCRVLATTGASSVEVVKKLGAHHVFDYKSEWIPAVKQLLGNNAVDVFYDCVGGETVGNAIQLMKPYGKIFTITNITGAINFGGKNLSIAYLSFERNGRKIAAIANLVNLGKLHPYVHKVFPLEDLGKAHVAAEAGGLIGKIVIKVTDDMDRKSLKH